MYDLPEYTLTEKLYESATTLIFRGYRDADRAPVAVKLLKSEHPSPLEIARIRHEYAMTRDLDLPGVIKTYSLVKHGDRFWLVMADLRGLPLDQVLAEERLDVAASLRIAASVADTLASLHRRQIIHKDVKPHNILVTSEARATCLIDFGIATRLAQETQRAQSHDTLEGTLSYMSPEQTGRMNRAIDYRTDLYSLGVTLYEMLTGVVPFPSQDPMELVHCHIAKRAVPPIERRSEIPEVVSSIVTKLLAKAAEDRYQSADGLRADLEECLSRLSEAGRIESFALGQGGHSGELHIPQKLYGREADLATLFDAFERAGQGAAELLLVSGYSGVGKSAFVHEIDKAIARSGGRFISGKFDQLSGSVPYAAVAHAFRKLLRSILSEPTESLERCRRRIQRAVDRNGRLLVELIPEIELVLGPQPSVPELGPTESQNRFNLVFQNFLRVFTTAEQPLVLFLDDLQWADPASLKLLDILLTDPARGHLLVIGAYRDSEVDAAHPLTATLNAIRRAGTRAREVVLKPLELSDVVRLICDALDCDDSEADPLARVVYEKTHGNPFFLGQFLKTAHTGALIAYDARERRFRWDLQGIQRMVATDNVVDFMAGKILRLSGAARRLIQIAACIGNEFDLRTLSILNEATPAETAADLRGALEEGLVVPLSSEYRFFYDREDLVAVGDDFAPSFTVSYRFLHDRVQQAAYSLIEGERRGEVHLRIGRLMRASMERDAELFDVLHHLNPSVALITDRGERASLARLNLTAGKRAKAATAYQAASSYFTAGSSLLEATSWELDYELSFELHLSLSECHYMTGAFERAEAVSEILLSHARSDLDRVRVHRLRVIFLTSAGRFADAMRVGRVALALFDIDTPERQEAMKASMARELDEVELNLADRRIEDILRAPVMTEPRELAVIRLLVSLSVAAYCIDSSLYGFISIKQVNISLKYGSSEVSAYGYMQYAVLLVGALGQYRRGYEFGRLALELNERFDNVEIQCKVNENFAGHVGYYRDPLRSSLGYFALAHQAGLASGDLIYLSYNALHSTLVRLGLGEELAGMKDEVDKALALMRRTNDAFCTTFLTLARQLVVNLTGGTEHRGTLSDAAFDEAAFAATLGGTASALLAYWYYTIKLQLSFLYEDNEAAVAMAALAEEGSVLAVAYYSNTEYYFYACLALLALGPGRSAAEREGDGRDIARYQAALATWAESCPENFRHKHLLVLAEQARVEGRELDAMALYDQAIEASRQSGFVHHEALSNELCARFHLARGRTKIARTYLTEAHYAYTRWGATAKVEQLEERYGHLILRGSAAQEPLSSPNVATTTGKRRGEQLDMETVLKASQVLSGEISFDRLLHRMISVVMENAGAERGALILQRESGLRIEAEVSAEGMTVPSDPAPVDERCGLSPGIIQYVSRTHERIILRDAAEEGTFTQDAYVLGRKPKSVLCMPLLHQGTLKGLLYLENNLVAGAFTDHRARLLSALCVQMAISIENAHLYANLEQKVIERTQELREAQARLIQLEKEATEVQMAGGFAHEIRNALAGAKLRMSRAYSAGEGAPRASLCVENADLLRSLFLFARERIDSEEIGGAADLIRKVATNERVLDEVLGGIDGAMSRALRITDLILEYSLLSKERRGSEPVDLLPIVTSVLAELESDLSAHRIAVEVDVAPGCGLPGTRRHFESMIRRLLQNARDALLDRDDGALRQIRVQGVEAHEHVALRISDTGHGIPEEDRHRIFDPFFSTKPTTGTGLGLGFVRKLAAIYGGTVSFESEMGRGTTFELGFPR